MNDKVVQLNVRGVPEELRTEFKVLCTYKRSDVSTELRKFMKKEVEKAKKDPKQRELFR